MSIVESYNFPPKRITDLLIIYQSVNFYVHQAILINKSKYFENLCEDKLTEPILIPNILDLDKKEISVKQFYEFLLALYSTTGFEVEQILEPIRTDKSNNNDTNEKNKNEQDENKQDENESNDGYESSDDEDEKKAGKLCNIIINSCCKCKQKQNGKTLLRKTQSYNAFAALSH